MPRRAPAIERTIAVLNLLASRPTERLSLSDISRQAGLNKATAHSTLWALSDAGYLVRDADGRYGLGPALVALGSAARQSQPAVEAAAPEMRALSEDLGLDCVASAAVGNEIVILARTGAPRPFEIAVLPGQRLPLLPPIGAVFVAWRGAQEIQAWLRHLGPMGAPAKQRFVKAVDAVRERGYSVGLEGDAQLLLRALRHEGENAPTVEDGIKGLGKEDYALIEVDPEASYRLSHVGAPVFGSEGGVALGLFLIGFQGPVPGREVERLAERLVGAAERVTKAVHGRAPE